MTSQTQEFGHQGRTTSVLAVTIGMVWFTITCVTSLTRINKYICESGICSRKAADVHVKRGVVFINEHQAMLGDKVSPGDVVTVRGVPVKPLLAHEEIVVALNKPVGVVCTAARTERHNIVDFVGHSSRIYPIGRLDKDSQGLILLTNRCDLVNRILHTGNYHEKEYRVTVDKPITQQFLADMSNGVPVSGTVSKQCTVVQVSQYAFTITLTQGLNRQIRRMCKHYHYRVKKLERVRIMHIHLDDLPSGEWRELDSAQVSLLLRELDNASTGDVLATVARAL